MSELTRERRKELRELGWSVMRRRARRPRRIPGKYVPSIHDADVVRIDEELDDQLVSLETRT